ncbi:hypothetical protein NADE_003165 [Nannochloris sp. 'desiccata']|nr:hypothetical protein KSW81_000786 [Chlorella desiccata (nom. nud.)]KAH7620548.1 hypothetical protein NADE_003165 [Chlorella desiccata (nom. nud.)]
MASIPSTPSSLKRGVSNVGKAASFSTPDEEVARIIKNKQNYYICLKVLKDSDPADIRTNYLRLSRLVHPDKCPNNPNAANASAILNQANDTLTNPIKKRLYDAYVTDVTAAAGTNASEMTYADWEAAQAAYPVQIPAWMDKVLRIPVLGQVIALIMLILLIPLLLVFLLLGVVLYCLCLPINILFRCCCGMTPAQMQAELDRQEFAAAAAADAAPRQEPPASRVGVESV